MPCLVREAVTQIGVHTAFNSEPFNFVCTVSCSVVDHIPYRKILRAVLEMAEICGYISRVAGFQGAARFQGNTLPYSNSNVVVSTIKLDLCLAY